MSREYVQAQLINWARWLEQSWTGGLGYPSTNILAKSLGSSACALDVIPINDLDARRTHQAVQALHEVRAVLHEVVVFRYLGDPQTSVRKRRPLSHAEIGSLKGVAHQTVVEWLKDAELQLDAMLTRTQA